MLRRHVGLSTIERQIFWLKTMRKKNERKKKLHIFQFLQLDIRSRKAQLGTFHIKKFLFFQMFHQKKKVIIKR